MFQKNLGKKKKYLYFLSYFFCDTIHTRQKIECLPYEGFFSQFQKRGRFFVIFSGRINSVFQKKVSMFVKLVEVFVYVRIYFCLQCLQFLFCLFLFLTTCCCSDFFLIFFPSTFSSELFSEKYANQLVPQWRL